MDDQHKYYLKGVLDISTYFVSLSVGNMIYFKAIKCTK